MKRVLYVVARHEQKLYIKFTKAYAGSETIQVVLDRRQRQRRQTYSPPATDRRKEERRWHDITKNLKTIGWAMVRKL
jgi:hypothetical protein